MSADPFAWAASLDTLFAQVWTRLARGVHDRHAPARHPVLATVDADGAPQVRTVVLRAADKAAGTLRLFTDLHSAKAAELRASPRAALHVWDSGAHLQIRINAAVSILTGPEVADLWEKVPDHSRGAYGGAPLPGAPIAAALDYTKTPDPAAFAVLHLRLESMDVLHLGPQHRRAGYRRADGWAGQWRVP